MTLSVIDDEIIIRSDNRLGKFLICSLVLCIWTISGIEFVYKFIITRVVFDILYLIPSILWLVIGLAFIFSFLWILFGIKQTTIKNGELIIIYKIGFLVIGKAKKFQTRNIKNIISEEKVYYGRGKKTIKNSISFEYFGAKKTLFSQISKTDSALLLSILMRKTGTGGT